MNRKAVIETIKEIVRLAVFGAVSAVLSYLATQVASLPPDSAYALAGTLVLRAADKYIHVSPKTDTKGLVPF